MCIQKKGIYLDELIIFTYLKNYLIFNISIFYEE